MPHPLRRVKALLLAAGIGSRLRPLTDAVPKCLVPILDRPLLDFWIESLAAAQITEARINTHSLAEQVRTYIAAVNVRGPLRLTEAHEPSLLGSAGTVAANIDLAELADEIVIVYADNLSDIALCPLLEFHRAHQDPFTMVLFRAPNPRACGIAELDADRRIVSLVEKPAEPASELANAGIYVLDASAYREIASLGAFDLGFDVLPRFVGRMRGWVWGGYHLDIGTLEALERARQEAPRVFAEHLDGLSTELRAAVFLDRDGTLIEHVHYLSDPAQVRLLPGAAEALIRLRRAGFRCVLVTNQSAIARGIITEQRLHEIHLEMNRQLAERGAALDGIYFCPEAPSSDDRTVIENSRRKPGPGMLLQAAAEMGLKLADSWMVGDLISDVLAGLNAGCRSILVASGQKIEEAGDAHAADASFFRAADFAAAARMILELQEERQ